MPLTLSGIKNDVVTEYNNSFTNITQLTKSKNKFFGVMLTRLVDILNTMSRDQEQLFNNNIQQIHNDLLAVKQHASSINIDINNYENFISILNNASIKLNIQLSAKKAANLATQYANISNIKAATLDERPENMQITRAEVGALYQDNIGLTFKERSPENDKENLKFLIAKHLEKQGITVDVTDINVQSRRDNNGYDVTLPHKCLPPLNKIVTPKIIEDSEIIKKLKTARYLDVAKYGQNNQGLAIAKQYDVFIQCVKNLQINNLADAIRLEDQGLLLNELNSVAQIKNFKTALNKATTLDERPTERHITSAEVGALYKNNAHLVILRARNPENDKKNLKDIIAKHLATQGITVDVTNIDVNLHGVDGYDVTLPHKCLEPLNNISSNNTPHKKNHL